MESLPKKPNEYFVKLLSVIDDMRRASFQTTPTTQQKKMLGLTLLFSLCFSVFFFLSADVLGWLVYLLVMLGDSGEITACFVAAMATAAYSEAMARIRKCPVTAYLLISSFPLVPGAGIYRTMEYALQRDIQMFLNQGLNTLGIAAALAVGVLVVTSAVRMLVTLRKKRRRSK